jgi:hypothetical protein
MFNFTRQLKELRSSIIGLVLLLATAVIGLIWLSIGLYSALTAWIGPVWAPLALGGICFLPLVVFWIVHLFADKDHDEERTVQAAYNSAYADSSVMSISRIIESLSGKSPFLATAAAIIAGFLATRFPALLTIFAQIVQAYAEDAQRRAAQKAAETPEEEDEA